MPSRRWIARNSSPICRRSLASRLLRGSSSSSTFGSNTSARAMATRCCWPPDSAGAGRSANRSISTRRSAFNTRSRISAAGAAAHAQGIGDVLEHRHMRPDRIGLEHHAEAAPLRRHENARGRIADDFVADADPAAGILLKAGHHAQRRGLAAARRPQQRDELALADAQIDVADGGEIAELPADLLEHNIRHQTPNPITARRPIS